MEISKKRSIFDKLKKYDHLHETNDFIEITEWTNGEGWDISLNEKKLITLTRGELKAINYLITTLDLNED